jgi:HlyD family secretion protein
LIRKLLTAIGLLATIGLFVGTLVFLWKRSQVEPTIYDSREPFTATIIKKAVATGSVVPRKEVAMKPQVSGIVEELYVEPGIVIKKGDLIAKVAIVPNMVNLAQAESRVRRAEIGLDDAEKEYARNRQLFEEGVLSASAFLTYETDLKTAKEEVAAANDNLALIREGARKSAGAATNTLVRATVEGMVLEVPIEEGDSVIEANTFNDGTTIASIANMDEMIFEGKVDESEVGKLEAGMPLVLTIGALDTERFDATLEYIAPKGVVENGAIQFEIRAALSLREGSFVRANYSANADIVLAKREDVLAIRESWMKTDGAETSVEVETGPQQFERRVIKTGLSDGITIEVLEGLTTADKVKDPSSGRRASEAAPQNAAAGGGRQGGGARRG